MPSTPVSRSGAFEVAGFGGGMADEAHEHELNKSEG